MTATEATIACPKCGNPNPIGAKFCSSCRTALGVATPPPGPTPPPPQRPAGGLAGMVGAGAGKSETRQLQADAGAVFEHLANGLRNRGGQVQQEMPQQLNIKVPYKSFWLTLGAVIQVDTALQVVPTAAGQCQATLTTKTDGSSLNNVWTWFGLSFTVLLFLNLYIFPIIILFGAASAFLTHRQLNSQPGAKITEGLFADLNNNLSSLSASADQPTQPAPGPSPQPAPQPTPPPGPQASAPASDASADDAEAEEEVFERLAKLAKLREMGAVTEEEFDAKKAELLKRI
ncbi:MAG: SHOCT domain-containing protein [Pseudomonadota bacterium]